MDKSICNHGGHGKHGRRKTGGETASHQIGERGHHQRIFCFRVFSVFRGFNSRFCSFLGACLGENPVHFRAVDSEELSGFRGIAFGFGQGALGELDLRLPGIQWKRGRPQIFVTSTSASQSSGNSDRTSKWPIERRHRKIGLRRAGCRAKTRSRPFQLATPCVPSIPRSCSRVIRPRRKSRAR